MISACIAAALSSSPFLINLAHGSLYMVGAYVAAAAFAATGSFLLGSPSRSPGRPSLASPSRSSSSAGCTGATISTRSWRRSG